MKVWKNSVVIAVVAIMVITAVQMSCGVTYAAETMDEVERELNDSSEVAFEDFDSSFSDSAVTSGKNVSDEAPVVVDFNDSDANVALDESIQLSNRIAKTITLDVGNTQILSCQVDTCTVRTQISNSAVVSATDVELSLKDGWMATFSVTGISEGTTSITLYDVFNDTIYADYMVNVKHTYDEGTITTIATCATDGIKTYTCTGCGETKIEKLGRDADNHEGTQVLVGEKRASCGTGYTGDLVCSACGYVYTKGSLIEALYEGHTVVDDLEVEPTCENAGKTAGSHCSVCEKTIIAQKLIPANGHTPVIDPAVLATKNTTGLTEGSHCSRCGTILVKQEVIPVTGEGLGHGVFDKDTVISSDVSYTGDVYIKQGCTVTLSGTTSIIGNVYVFGTLNNRGKLTITGTLNTLHYGSSMSAGNYSYGYFYNYSKVTINSLNVTNSFLNTVVPGITHTYNTGKVITPSTCMKSGMKRYECTVCGYEKVETIEKLSHNYQTKIVKATTASDGYIEKKCNVGGETASKTVIYYPKTVSLSKTNLIYSGKVQKPKVIVKGSDGKTIVASNYTVAYSGGCKNVGKYTVKITFKGNYSGTVSKTYMIVPRGTTFSNISARSKGFIAKWKKQKTQTSGYQIQYATNKKFTGAKTANISKNGNTSKKISKLACKKKYYVRIRTYKKTNGKTYYSSWSATKTVTTKK